MSSERNLGTPEKITALSQRLATSSKVRRYDDSSEPQSWTLAYTFSELEESFRKFTEVQLPKLFSERLNEEQIDDLLHEIGEEFRHILYHIKDPKFYEYLSDDE